VPKDTHRTATTDDAQLQLPEQVTLAVAELASAAREGLLALAVGTGLQVQTLMAEDVARLVGVKGRHNPDRTAVRHGSEPGQVTLGGRRVRIRRPRVRSADGTQELPVPAYQAFASADLLEAEAELEALARSLEQAHPGAAASLRRGADRDLDDHPAGRAAHPGKDLAQHQFDRVDDRDLPRSRRQRQALAGRADGAALGRRRHG
jgi:hypothetical protein